jgi:hypothetical protein
MTGLRPGNFAPSAEACSRLTWDAFFQNHLAGFMAHLHTRGQTFVGRAVVMLVMEDPQNLGEAGAQPFLVHRAEGGHGNAALAGFNDKRFDVLLGIQELGQAGNPGIVECVW